MIPNAPSRLSHTLVAVLGFVVATAFAEPERQADANFNVPRTELLSTVKTIGVMPITVEGGVPDADGVSARYDADIVARLQGAGFSVVPPSVMREIRGRIDVTLGGTYDPVTGERIKEKADILAKSSNGEYLASHKIDALLESAIVLRSVHFSFDEGQWNGVTESSSGRSGLANFMTSMSGARVAGQLPALSLTVRLSDPAGKLLYTGAGGIQLLGYAHPGVHKMLTAVRQEDVNAKFIMTERARDARALSLALDPLVRGSAPTPIKIASLPAGAASATTIVTRDELIRRYPRLAVAPLPAGDSGVTDEIRPRYREALAQRLTQLGFEVVGGDDYRRLWDTEQAAVGGYFDPFSGKLDKDKLKVSRLRVFESMTDHQAVTAVVLPQVIERSALFSAGVAEWDGVKESIEPGKSSLGALLDGSMNYGGRLRALSLEVLIIDPSGELLFKGIGGIHLTERFAGGGSPPLTAGELFADPNSDKRPVDIALAMLAAPGNP